ncbi:TPA: phage replisome organizer N-terminal domain-containing protein [Clostridium botulinum]|uniref:phage replisome organizer N-terminal domain-containing protein n=1 Tax=Clostridium botulinum TaxID=1491 RepID=UPI0029BBD7D8|nr:phage replisome organizer N-terminal domain-containing protein [Clostridium botulinum]HDK7188744.1 phage replisome organizer N-terminal domain-containing protein [Clostridium botulinum]HDK7215663.1 phage replisome organizer N-terminal domain-containing protein [Clostridium botulinum]HDK7231417.1 phage replisome organizer N-terminal domain-containing protein [Clostridium botulinum]HDK7261167.1 phage replisome organizer N-terminal domain-containing protein [Clostridium botulinum]
MSDNKKYYYLKLKESFYERDEMVILESMPDGYMYSNILLKLYLRSLKNDGKLLVNERIPYNATMLANITRMPVAVVEKAIQMFKELGLIEILDNGAIYMLDIQLFIGESSTEADRKKLYRKKIEEEKLLASGQMSGQMSDKTPPEIELEKEIDIEIEKDTELEKEKIDTKVSSSNKLQSIIDKWNSLNLNKLISINSGTTRYQMTNTRIKEYDVDSIIKAMDNIKYSSFLRGQNNRSWIIKYDWFIKPNNFIKVLEGNYTDKEGTNGGIKQDSSGNKKQEYDFSRFEG